MIEYDVLCLGLTRVQKQTLFCHFPSEFCFFDVSVNELVQVEREENIFSKARCIFINPKKLTSEELNKILEEHKYAIYHFHAAVLLFTEPFTMKQKQSIDTQKLMLVDLRTGHDYVFKNIVEIIKNASVPCMEGMEQMKEHMLSNEWYLVDLETTGNDPLEEDIISMSVSHMADYRILSTKTVTILGSECIKREVVEYLNDLGAPLIIKSRNFELPFLKVLYHFFGEKFELPYIAIDGLAAISFGYTCLRDPYDLTFNLIKQYLDLRPDKYERTLIENFRLASLYDLTLMVFEDLQERYGVQCVGDFGVLY